MKRLLSLGIVTLGALLGACSSDSPTAPSNHPPTDLATVLREMTLPSISGVSGAVIGVAIPPTSAVAPSNCPYSTSAQSFQCPTITTGGLTITQSYTLLDAAGRSQASFDPATTAAVRMKTSMKGTMTADGSNLTVDQTQDMTLSGLLTSTHVLNGTSVMKMNGTVSASGTTTPITTTMTMTMSNLVMPTVTSSSLYPLSGTITSDMVIADAGISLSARTEMTFNGTSKVSVVTTIGGLTQRCTVDLSNPTPTCG
jgi:hypothetical protein